MEKKSLKSLIGCLMCVMTTRVDGKTFKNLIGCLMCVMTTRVDGKTFKSLIGYLMYRMTTRPYIFYARSLLYHFMYCSSEIHLKATKLALKYIKRTISFGFSFKKSKLKATWFFVTVIGGIY